MSKYFIETELGVDWQDTGPWRSFSMSAVGDTLEELLEDITIAETDQDGGELDCYGIDDAARDVQKAVYATIETTILKQGVKK